jgi:hypothetical protein
MPAAPCALQYIFKPDSNRITQTEGEVLLAEDKLYRAEYVGSGTFIISKPKRKKHKMRQTALRNPQRGSRK